MNKSKLLIGMIATFFLAGCASMEKKFGEKVGCTESETTVERTLMVPAYSQYKVMCKNVEYTCRIAPFSETCNKADNAEKK